MKGRSGYLYGLHRRITVVALVLAMSLAICIGATGVSLAQPVDSPEVHAVEPDDAGQYDVVLANVFGDNFDNENDGQYLNVWLDNDHNFRDIDGLIMPNPKQDQLQVIFTFLGDQMGLYDLKVENTRTDLIGTLEDAFLVGEGPEPPPVVYVTIESPDDGTFPLDSQGNSGAGDTVEVEAEAVSNKGTIEFVDIFIDGQMVTHDSEPPYGYQWDFSGEENGSHEVTAYARDSEGNEGYTLTPTHVYRNDIVPNPSREWFLPEGSTAWGFETYVLIENPNDGGANVNLQLLKEQGDNEVRDYKVAGNSRFTVCLNDIAPNCDLSTLVTSSEPVICERAMYWKERVGGHDSIGTTRTSPEWYLAEGSTAWGFETWYLVANPTETDTVVEISLMGNDGSVTRAAYGVPAQSRKTVNASDIVPNADVSATIRSLEDVDIACERAMYWRDRTGGHDTIGVTDSAISWYLAEGTTIPGFETWVLVENPEDTATEITATFMPAAGGPVEYSVDVGPHSRHTIRVNDVVPNSDVSIEVIGDHPVICERAMYWNDKVGGHDTIGSPTPGYTWYMAEGCTAFGFETWLLLQNPNALRTALIELRLLKSGTGVQTETYLVPPMSRFTVSVNGLMGTSPGDVSMEVESNIPVVAERSMYWGQRTGGHVSVSCRGLSGE